MTALVDRASRRLGVLLGAQPGGSPPLTPEQERYFRLRRAEVLALQAPIGNALHTVTIVIAGTLVLPSALGPARLAWGAAMLGLAVNSMRLWRPRRRASAGVKMRTLNVETSSFALLYAVMVWYCLTRTDVGDSAPFISTIAAVVGAGAMHLAIHRRVALTWVWSYAVLVSIGFVAAGGAVPRLFAFLLVFYCSSLSIGITHLSGSFERRCIAEFAAESEREVVRVLLDDPDGGSQGWLWQLDAHGALCQVSARFAHEAATSAEALAGVGLAELFERLDVDATEEGRRAAAAVQLALARRTPFRDVALPVTVAGARRWWQWSARPLPAALGGGWSGVGTDITDDRHHQLEVLRLATVDELTGLANRHRFTTELDRRVASGPTALGIVDLDNFKEINDTLGHATGDRLLAAVAGRLRESVGAAGICARLGGDEFALLLEAGRPARVDQAFRRIERSLRRAFAVEEVQLQVTGCIGYAIAPTDGREASDLLQVADLALYDAKVRGHGTVRRFDASLAAQATERARVRRELGGALADDQLEVWYQPQVDLRTGAVRGVEALARWRHPEHGILGPASFIPVAEETGLIFDLGARVLQDATSAIAALPTELTVAINVSAVQLASPDLPTVVADAVDRSGVDPARLVLEVTESQLVDRSAVVALRHLRSTGLQIAIDDFGTGYSSLATLRTLPIDELKVDQAFVTSLDDEELLDPVVRRRDPSSVLVAAIVDVADALSLRVVAEGIETEVQAAVLQALGCTVGQGYAFGRPAPLAHLQRTLAATAGARTDT
ncbi:MAG: EAL domain-containing protein [Acidimicrobiales bacterium]|nr:EAL domain-containing protein [Acidimicrobiales bacterium]